MLALFCGLGYFKNIESETANNQSNKIMTYQETEAALKTATAKFNAWKKSNNESGAGFNPFEDEVCELSKKLVEIKRASSPLVTDLAGERAAFNAQKFTGKDLQKASKWCLARGYSMADLQAAVKAAK